MADQRFRPEYRIRHATDFRRAFKRRRSAGDHMLLVFGHPNGLPYPRLGLSVSRRVGGAVFRNRWKRLIREAFRTSREELPQGFDFVVVPRQGIEPELDSVRRSLVRMTQRAVNRKRKPE
jgi:ribonuclease P protein component